MAFFAVDNLKTSPAVGAEATAVAALAVRVTAMLAFPWPLLMKSIAWRKPGKYTLVANKMSGFCSFVKKHW